MRISRSFVVIASLILASGAALADFGFPAIVFARNSFSLDEQAKSIAEEAAVLLRRYPSCDVILTGSRGTSETDPAISSKRLSSVSTAIVDLGIAQDRITLSDLGDKKALHNACPPDQDRDYCEEFVRTVEFTFTACAL